MKTEGRHKEMNPKQQTVLEGLQAKKLIELKFDLGNGLWLAFAHLDALRE